MRDSPTVPHAGPGLAARDPTRSDLLTIATPQVGLAVLLGLGAAAWQHWAQFAGDVSLSGHLPHLALDAAFGMPAAGLAIWLAGALLQRRSPLDPKMWTPTNQRLQRMAARSFLVLVPGSSGLAPL